MSSPSQATKPRRSPCSATVWAEMGEAQVPYGATNVTLSTFLRRSLASALSRALSLRHLRAGTARFREADGNRLLSTRHTSAGPTALERPALALLHGTFDLLARLRAVFSHAHPPYARACMRDLCRNTTDAKVGRNRERDASRQAPSRIARPAAISQVMLPMARRV